MKITSGNWKILLFNGIAAILYAVLAIFASEALIITLVFYIGLLVLLSSLGLFYGVYLNYKNGIPYSLDLFEAVVVFGFGIILTFYSQESIKLFMIIVGSWAILIGLGQLFFAFKLPDAINGKKTMLLNSILTIALGIILFSNPFKSANILVVISGILSLITGIILIILALKVKNITDE